jgi:hypothetical protein
MKSSGFVQAAYGVDLAPDRARVVCCVRNRRGCSCETVYDGALPVSGEAAGRLREAEARLDTAVVGSLSPHVAFARWVHTPLNSVEKSLRVFPSLLDVQIPFAVEQCEVAAAQVRREENRAISILAVACRRDDIRQAMEEFKAAGVEPDVLDHEGLALWSQSLREHPGGADGPRAVAFVRDRSVTLAVGEGATETGFLAAQRFRLGNLDFSDLVRGPAARCEFAAKLRQMLLVHIPERLEPMLLALFWSGTLSDAARGELETELRAVGPPRFFRHDQPEMFLARALATRATLGESAGSNLLMGRLAPLKEKRRSERMHARLAGALAAAGISLAVSAAALWGGAVRQSRYVEQRVAAEARELSGLARVPRGQELLVVRRALSERAASDAVLRRFAKDDLAERVAGSLSLCAQLGAELEWMSWRDEAVSMRGSFKDWNHGEALTQWLEKQGFTVNLTRKDADADGRVPFTLSASRGAPETGR